VSRMVLGVSTLQMQAELATAPALPEFLDHLFPMRIRSTGRVAMPYFLFHLSGCLNQL
jgi:hypothetical protein